MNNFPQEIIEWYEEEGRDFPWRKKNLTPYKAFMTEILLQRTRAETVQTIWNDFFENYPNLKSLNSESEKNLANFLHPLGFQNRRARDIKKTAKILLEEQSGEIPEKPDKLLNLPGVGIYIANATLCFGFNQKIPVADTNVKRVIEFVFDKEVKDDLRNEDELWNLLEDLIPENNYKQFNWALLDLGAKIRSGDTPKILVHFSRESN